MKCPKCESKCIKDEVTGMWFCDECQSLYDEKEFESKEHIGIGFLIMMSFLLLIPIVNIIVIVIISNSGIDDKYKNSYCSLVIGEMIITAVVVVYGILLTKSNVDEEAVATFNKLYNTVKIKTEIELIPEIEVVYDTSIKGVMDSYKPVVKVEESEEVLISKNSFYNFEIFQGSYLKGSEVINFLKSYGSEDMAFIIQTKAMRDKNGKESYRNYGLRLNGTTEGSDKSIRYLEPAEEYSVYTNDYEETQMLSTKDVEKKKYIFYVNPKSLFKFELFTFEDFYVMQFTELEE